jgi:hypothetical protein
MDGLKSEHLGKAIGATIVPGGLARVLAGRRIGIGVGCL